jgi:glycine hydroxymethyltransferase
MTTRGFGQEQARMTAHLIADVLEAPDDAQHIAKVRTKVAELVAPFPVYGDSVLHP